VQVAHEAKGAVDTEEGQGESHIGQKPARDPLDDVDDEQRQQRTKQAEGQHDLSRQPGDGPQTLDAKAILGLVSAAAVALFALLPVGLVSMAPLAVLGAGAFAQAVWNTSHIRERSNAAYQARLQAITSMACTLGFSLGMLWASLAIDRFGLTALVGGTGVLGLLSVAVVIV